MGISTHFAIFILMVMSFWLSFYENVYISFLIPLIFLFFSQKVHWLTLFKRVLFLNIFIFVALFSIVLHGDYSYAFLVFMRSNILLLVTMLLFWQKDIFQIAYGFAKLGFPQKLNTIMFFLAKFVSIMKSELKVAKKALHVRTFRNKTDIFTYSVYANLLAILIIKAFDRAQKLNQAMELRGCDGVNYYSDYEKSNLYDFTLSLLVFISLAVPFWKIDL
jgi:cobalt/nickel transport system permease protein